jgi:predicted aconitase with swiveling domain
MDMGKRNALTALGLVGFVAIAAGSTPRRTSSSSDAGSTSVATATLAPTASTAKTPDPQDLPDPTTDYKAIDDAKLDGQKAIGKTLLLRVWRGNTDASTVTLFACGKAGTGGFLTATYSVDKRALVKSIPASIPLHEHCPRVVLKLTGKEAYTNDFKADLQQIMDVTPAEPEKLPPGIDYVSMDDINIDGKKAAGKIAQLRMYRGKTEEKKFTGYPCGKASGLNFLYVTFSPDQKDAVKDLSTSALSCQTVKLKLTNQQAYTSTWNASLVEVGKE